VLVLPINGLDTCINRCLSIDLIFSTFYQQHLLDCTYQYLYQQGRRQGFGGRPALLWDLGCPCCGNQDHSCHCRLPGTINSVKLTSRKYLQTLFWKSVFSSLISCLNSGQALMSCQRRSERSQRSTRSDGFMTIRMPVWTSWTASSEVKQARWRWTRPTAPGELIRGGRHPALCFCPPPHHPPSSTGFLRIGQSV